MNMNENLNNSNGKKIITEDIKVSIGKPTIIESDIIDKTCANCYNKFICCNKVSYENKPTGCSLWLNGVTKNT